MGVRPAGIPQPLHEETAENWIFKGGGCLKTCYCESYRFSEDLDFTLRDESHADEEFPRPVLVDVARWVTEQSGLTIPADQIAFNIHTNPRGRASCQGKAPGFTPAAGQFAIESGA